MEGEFGRDFAPVKVGEELDVRIEAVGEKGDGIAKVKGFVLFVPNAKEGDEVKVRITKVLRKVGFAEVIGEGSVPKGEHEQDSNQSAQEAETPEEQPPDTEDFGEEPEEEKKE
ncbi:TRAM domain-containing protein [Candidatus Woesearchaeota archaeon]|nr:TRAM domain-containing protein [Candidatus Woesearchaeota archaeon]